MNPSNKNDKISSVKRIRFLYAVLILVVAVFALRLFYLQIISYGHYRAAALSDQLKQYEIPAERGTISAYEGDNVLPIVLNQQLFIVYADPVNIKNPEKTAEKLSGVLSQDQVKIEKLIKTKKTRYVVLAKKVDPSTKDKVANLKLPGVGAVAQDYRTYPQGALASQLLGFVNDDGKGVYGVEQALNKELSGQAGQLKAITDANGIPLAASKDNTLKNPVNGKNVVLTVDLAMQQQLENILAEGVKNAKAPGGSAVIMDAHTGAVKAMANVPTYDPSQYFKYDDPNIFQNGAVTHSIEVGSTMKTLTTAAALNQGVVNTNTSYYDPSFWMINDFKVTNIEEDGGAGTRTLKDILNLSLNTGVTWELMQMGGGQINLKARQAWYDYLTNHYQFGKATGIEQGYESEGYVPKPQENGAGINLTYANTAFGQALTATPIQMAAALSSVVNGGTYYQPHLIDKYVNKNGSQTDVKPKIIKQNVVSKSTTEAIIPLMQYVVDNHTFNPKFDQSRYTVGGKTGTAQIAKPGGGYYDDQFNGTYAGFVGGDNPDYVIVVFVYKPTIKGYAGSAAAQPIFGSLAHMLIDNSYVNPKGQ